MAILIVLFSGFAGMLTALVALIGYDVAWSQALVIYLVASTLPAALLMAALYLQVLIRNALAAPDTAVEATIKAQRLR